MTSDVQKPITNCPTTHPTNKLGSDTLGALRQAIFMLSLPFGILSFALPIYGKEIGADAVQIGLFLSAFSLMTVLLRPIVGAGLDRYGRLDFLRVGAGNHHRVGTHRVAQGPDALLVHVLSRLQVAHRP